MALIARPRRNTIEAISTYRGQGYAPDTVDSFVSLDNRNFPWVTIGKALADETNVHSAKRHGAKGSTTDHKMTAAEALAAIGMDLTIESRELAVVGSLEPLPFIRGIGYEGPDGFEALGYMTDKYQIVQPAEGLEFIDQIVHDHGGANITAAWSMRGRRQLGVTIDFPETITVDPMGANDVTSIHGLGINSFDGSAAFQFAVSTVRWFCLNQFTPALRAAKRSIKFKHTTGITGKVQAAREALGLTLAYAEELDGVANRLYQARFTDDEFWKLVQDVFPLSDDATDLQTHRAITRWENIMENWQAPHNANIHGTRWGAAQAIGEFAEWGRPVRATRRSGNTPEQQRAIGTLTSWPAAMVTTTTARLLEGVN